MYIISIFVYNDISSASICVTRVKINFVCQAGLSKFARLARSVTRTRTSLVQPLHCQLHHVDHHTQASKQDSVHSTQVATTVHVSSLFRLKIVVKKTV